MKIKATRKELASRYFCKAVGYCDLQRLFRCTEPNYYTCGVYGWNFDAYTFGNKCITTGYRGMIGERVPSELIEKYETAAAAVWAERIPYEEQRKKVDALIEQFFNEAF